MEPHMQYSRRNSKMKENTGCIVFFFFFDGLYSISKHISFCCSQALQRVFVLLCSSLATSEEVWAIFLMNFYSLKLKIKYFQMINSFGSVTQAWGALHSIWLLKGMPSLVKWYSSCSNDNNQARQNKWLPSGSKMEENIKDSWACSGFWKRENFAFWC